MNLQHSEARFFELPCEPNLEGIICKPKTSPYPFTWIKVKNPNYSQAVGRREMLSVCSRGYSTKPNSSFLTVFRKNQFPILIAHG